MSRDFNRFNRRHHTSPKQRTTRPVKIQPPTFAAIDLGTTNCRLLVASPTPHSFNVKETFSRITRLGEGLVASGVLSERAIKRTIFALKLCAKKLAKYRPAKARYVATEACRRATNGAEFIRRVREETGLDMEIISFEEECRLGVAGCLPLINRNIRHALVFDIGGGSTEVSWAKIDGENRVHLEGTLSFPLGVITVSEAFTGKGLSSAGYRAVVRKVRSYLEPFEEKHAVLRAIEQGDVQMIGTSGTVTTIGAFHLDLPYYNRSAVDGLALSYDDLGKAKRRLEKLPYAEKVAHPCIGPQRADLSLAGCAILQGICDMWPIGEITVADRGLREGVLLDLMQSEGGKVAGEGAA
ncbi:MAG: Ppx/GppA phosphatase family protein [Alphaproteobacteria bacterium]